MKREDNGGLLVWEQNNLFTFKHKLTQLKPNAEKNQIGEEKVNN